MIALVGWESMRPITPETVALAVRYLAEGRVKTLAEFAESMRWLWFRPVWGEVAR